MTALDVRDLDAVLAPWQPLHFDFDGPRTEPDWLVDDLIARGEITVLSGDTSSAKSFALLALALAVVEGGQTWLGHDVRGPARVLYIDGEMENWEIEDRLRGFGFRNQHWAGLLYLTKQQRISIDLPEHRERLERVIAAFQPDLVVVDTFFSTTCRTNANDPTEVARFFSETLRPLARGTSLVLAHHENKKADGGRNPEQAMTGARQWAAQADRHLILTPLASGRVENEEPLANGNVRGAYGLRLDSGKTRGSNKPALRLSLVTLKNAAGHRLQIDLNVVGDAESETTRLVRAVQDLLEVEGEMGTSEVLAAGLGPERSVHRALRDGPEAGVFRKIAHGRYAPTQPELGPS